MNKKARQSIMLALALTLTGSLGAGMAMWSANAATADVMQDGNYVGRAFDADYDKMLEDFAAAAPQDTATGAEYADDGVLSVNYTGGENSDDMDGAIYKIASGTASATTPWPYTHLVIEMSSPDGSAKLSELAIHLRELSDASTTDAIPFDAELLDPTSATEIGTAKTKIAIDMQTYVTNAGLTSMVNNGIAGYHLVAKSGETGTVVIHDVYLANVDDEVPDFGAQNTKTLADFENGTKVDQQPEGAGIYWCGSEVGVVIPKHVQLTDDTYTLPAGAAGYSSLALTVRGTGSLTVGGKAWSELKGPDGNAVPAITGSFATYVIDLAASALGGSDTAIALAATGVVDVQNAFLTNMEIADAEIQQIPFLDTATANRVDDFTYANKVAIGGDYEAAITDEANADAGVQYRLSYSNGDKVSIANGALTFDATDLGDGYINFKTQSVKSIEGYEYFVLKVKGEDGATLDGFRFGLGVDGTAAPIVWGNGGLKSDTNLVIPALGSGFNPYAADGWEYIVVDIAASGLVCGNTVDMYYSGVGKLHVDEMFYCNGLERGGKMEVTPFNAEAADIVVETTGYAYNYIGGGAAGRYLAFEAKGEAGAKLDEFRFTFDGVGGTYWLGANAEGTAVGLDGKLLPALTEEYQTYVIDLEKSGMKDWANIQHVHLHATLGEGKVTIKGAGFATYDIVEENTQIPAMNTETNYEIPANNAYHYAGYVYFGNNVNSNRYLAITAKGTEGIMDNELRLEFGGVTMYWKDNANLLVDPNGAALAPITSEYQTFYIDLDAIGAPRNVSEMHIHSTGNKAATLTIKSIGFATTDALSYADVVMPTFDSTKPTVEVTTAATAKVGDTVTVSYTASDDVTAQENLTVEVSVTFNGTPVELTENSFVAQEGAYVVTVTVTDEEGNVNADSVTVTVTAGSGTTNPPAGGGNGTEEGGGCSGCNGSITAGVIGTLTLMGVALVVLRKKEDK